MAGEMVGRLAAWVRRAAGIATVAAALVAGAGPAEADAPAGAIRYCVDPDWAPYEIINDARQHEGIAADLLGLAAQRAGVRLELVPTASWPESLEAVRDGRCDMLSFLNATPSRQEWLTFTSPLLIDHNVIVTREDHAFVNDLATEGPVTMVLPKGTSIEERVRRDFPEVVIITVPDEVAAFAMVSRGEADMTLRSMSVSVYAIRKHGFFNLKVAGQVPGYENRLRAAFRHDAAALAEVLDRGIKTLTAQEQREVANRHVSITIATPTDYGPVWRVAAVFSVVLVTSLVWALRLRYLNGRVKASEERYRTLLRHSQEQGSALAQSNADLEQFAYAVSHDLRQPLRMIVSYVDLLTRRHGAALSGDAPEFLGFVRDGARRMDQMLVSLLEFSRVGRSGEPPVTLSSRAVVEEAISYLQPAIAEAGAQVRLHGDWPEITASGNEMVRLFQNLIGNAAKYRVPGRTPEIDMIGRDAGAAWSVSVRDNGIGVEPSQAGRLFQVFQRLHTQAEYEGTGVGLAICRRIVERHGGQISMESEGVGRGCTIHVTLPHARAEAAEAAAPIATESEQRDATA